jgi:hypothetical protein
LFLPGDGNVLWACRQYSGGAVEVGVSVSLALRLSYKPFISPFFSLFFSPFFSPCFCSPIRYFSFSVFAYRSYVCDPDAIMVMALVAGAAFGMLENIEYIGLNRIPATIRVFPFSMHIMCQMLMGTFISERRFVSEEDIVVVVVVVVVVFLLATKLSRTHQ